MVEDAADGTVVLDVNGVGYEVVLPIGTLGRMLAASGSKSGTGAEVTVFVHTHVREDVFALFGFATREDRAAFRALIGVAGIGPKTAMAVLGALPGQELATTVGRGDVAKLTKVPGIGKKTAERMVLELKEKLPLVAGGVASVGVSPAAVPPGSKGDLVQRALVDMGFKGPEAERAVAALGDKVESLPLAELVRQALAQLVR